MIPVAAITYPATVKPFISTILTPLTRSLLWTIQWHQHRMYPNR
jgi:hypothetical protein